MPRFFIHKSDIRDATVVLVGEAAQHISQSLRMTVGEKLTLCDNEGLDYLCEIVSLSKDAVTLSVVLSSPSLSEPPYRIRLYQCLPKGDKLETVIQKAVECGVSEIVPVQSSRCIVKWKADDAKKKLVRYNRIAEEAAKQSGRGKIPTVLAPVTYQEAIKAMANDPLAFLCYENEENVTLPAYLRLATAPDAVSFLVGPEGGLASEEVAIAREMGVVSLSLGERILRTETAAPFVLAILSAFFEL